jgi:hypothetical protein
MKYEPGSYPPRRIETRELIATVRRVAREQRLYRIETILHLNLAAAELERLAYPTVDGEMKAVTRLK